MTTVCQKYYTKNILPTYICTIHKACTQGNGLEPWMLQEDNDPSHGNGPRSLRGLATCLKEANWIHCMRHPPQSPESFKQQVHHCVWHTLDELKEILQDEW